MKYCFSPSRFFSIVLAGMAFISHLGCGVKGKPLPPLEQPMIGRGAPSYKRTAEEAKPKMSPTPTPDRDSR